jgi:hypothetical protein
VAFDGTATGNTNRIKFWIDGVRLSPLNYDISVPANTTNSGTPQLMLHNYFVDAGSWAMIGRKYFDKLHIGVSASDAFCVALSQLTS